MENGYQPIKGHVEDKPEIPSGIPSGYQPEKSDLDSTNPPKQGSAINDLWKHRSEGMKCETCMWHVNYRCRKHAPTLGGFPAVFPTDWCGDHKLDKVTMGGE